MNFPISIGRTSLFQILGVVGGIFHFYSNFNRTFCKQIVVTLIRCRVLRRLIWVCTVCQCPTKRMLGLYGLTNNADPDRMLHFVAVHLSLHYLPKNAFTSFHYEKVKNKWFIDTVSSTLVTTMITMLCLGQDFWGTQVSPFLNFRETFANSGGHTKSI